MLLLLVLKKSIMSTEQFLSTSEVTEVERTLHDYILTHSYKEMDAISQREYNEAVQRT